MAVNLTPQYLKAQEEYRRAQSPEEELKWLETMWKEIPKHKASEKLQMELKTKLSELKKELQGPKKPAAKGSSIKIPRQGAGMVLILGGPNAGKSQLLASLTRATPEIAEYPFTTRQPLPGMMNWEDVTVQLVDTPPITADYLETYMQGLIRGADACVLMVDLGADEGVEQCQEFLDRLNATKTRLGRESTLDEEDIGRSYTQTLLVPNKIDAPGAMERLELFRELVPLDLPEYPISAKVGTGLDALKEAIYRSLNVIRVYTKTPAQKPTDVDKPFTLRAGGTLLDVAEMVHKELAANLKYARLWGVGRHPGEQIKADFVLQDKDVVELHTA